VKTINVTEKTGKLVGILDVAEKEDLMITCKSGVIIRMKVSGISEQGRATQGVKLIRLDEGDEIAGITRLEVEEMNGNGNGLTDGNGEGVNDRGPNEQAQPDDAPGADIQPE
jgi:DNA gyrase subunit A